jgi:hypothetical protein
MHKKFKDILFDVEIDNLFICGLKWIRKQNKFYSEKDKLFLMKLMFDALFHDVVHVNHLN